MKSVEVMYLLKTKERYYPITKDYDGNLIVSLGTNNVVVKDFTLPKQGKKWKFTYFEPVTGNVMEYQTPIVTEVIMV